jgi:uncharacterized protein YunC (DUF1805 family)
VLDGRTAEGARIAMPGAPPLIFVRGEKGVIFCGYLSLEAAEKFDLAAVIVRRVKSIDEMLEKDASLWTKKAAALGVMEGMTGKEALNLLL